MNYMNLVPLFRVLSLAMLGGSIAAVIVGGGAFAQNNQLPISIPGNSDTSSVARSTTVSDLPPAPPEAGTNALNWAGYVATGGTYTSVSGSWLVPDVQSDTSENVADATWVGIGGVNSRDLLQAGTEALPDGNGNLVYQAWMEMLPQDSKVVPLRVSAGDSVTVSITEESKGTWDVAFYNATTGKSYSATVNYSSSFSSADWIEEMPVEVGGVIGLDNFGTLRFTSGYAIKNGQPVTIASSGARPLTMNNAEGEAVATPSVLSSDGSSFTVARTDAVSTPLALTAAGITPVDIPSPYADLGDGYGLGGGGYDIGGYTVHIRRHGGGYRLFINF